MLPPKTKFAWNGDIALAYQVLGEGTHDLLYAPGVFSNIDVMWEDPLYEAFLRRLASFGRLIAMDRRGVGCSERFSPSEVAPLEVHADDIITVLDAVGSKRAAYLSNQDGNFIGCLLAASNPARISHLVLIDPAPCWTRNDEIPWEWSEEDWSGQIDRIRSNWGSEEDAAFQVVGPDAPEVRVRWGAKLARLSQSPGAMAAETEKYSQTDVRSILPSIQVPTLVVRATHARYTLALSPRYVADHIPGARFVELPMDVYPWEEGAEPFITEIEEFITGVRSGPSLDRVLATVMFTDIVGSTDRLSRLGDRGWADLMAQHDALVRSEIARHRGTEIDRAGDGFFATFDGPARAVRCAIAVSERVRGLGIEIRAGAHTGEVELAEDGLRGMAVHIGARIMGLALGNEVLVSATVRDLVVGSGLTFEDAGDHELKGVPDRWHLFRVVNEAKA